MGWRELMQPGKKKIQEPSETVTKVSKPMESAPEHTQTGGFVNIVTDSEGSQKCSTGEVFPFRIHDRVGYRIPDPKSSSPHPEWQEHNGQVLQVDGFREEVVIRPLDEPGEPWRSIWWGYVRKASDGQG